MMRILAPIAAVAVAVAATAGPVSAQGLEFLHDQRVEGGRVCMVDHFHHGSSGGHDTRAAAEREAIASWSGFTAWEYGDRWGSWRIAASRKASCSQLTGSWGCQVEARPCRPQIGSGPARPRAKTRPRAKAKAKAQ
jgi:hypothetical protein